MNHIGIAKVSRKARRPKRQEENRPESYFQAAANRVRRKPAEDFQSNRVIASVGRKREPGNFIKVSEGTHHKKMQMRAT